MKILRILVTLFLFSAPALLFSQVTIKGELRLGDTTQVHILNTADGGRMIGRVIGFDEVKVTFLFKNTNRLVFKLDEVKSIEVEGSADTAPTPRPDSPPKTGTAELAATDFIYAVETRFDKVYSGKLVYMTSRSLRLEKDAAISLRNVKNLSLVSEPFTKAAAKPEKLHVLKTDRGDIFRGQVMDFDGSTLRFMLENESVLKFSPEDIVTIKLEQVSFSGSLKNYTSEEDAFPHGERQDKLFASPTGFNLEKGEGEFRNVMVLYNSVDYGLSDNITIGGGLMTVIAASVVSARAKLGFDLSDFVHVAAGGQIYLGLAVGTESESLGLGYGVISLGSKGNFINLGISRVTQFSDSFNNDLNVLTIGGSLRAGQQWRFYGEYLRIQEVNFSDTYGFMTGGASWFKREHKLDFGMAIFPIDAGDIVVPIPIVAYSLRF